MRMSSRCPTEIVPIGEVLAGRRRLAGGHGDVRSRSDWKLASRPGGEWIPAQHELSHVPGLEPERIANAGERERM
jgi:hypothetical protein